MAHRLTLVTRNVRDCRWPGRAILEAAVRPEGRLLLGTALSAASRKLGLTNADIEALEETLEQVRDRRPAEPMKVE